MGERIVQASSTYRAAQLEYVVDLYKEIYLTKTCRSNVEYAVFLERHPCILERIDSCFQKKDSLEKQYRRHMNLVSRETRTLMARGAKDACKADSCQRYEEAMISGYGLKNYWVVCGWTKGSICF